jgi:AMP deaminase
MEHDTNTSNSVAQHTPRSENMSMQDIQAVSESILDLHPADANTWWTKQETESDIKDVCADVRHIIGLRRSNIELSLQRLGDNPRDDDESVLDAESITTAISLEPKGDLNGAQRHVDEDAANPCQFRMDEAGVYHVFDNDGAELVSPPSIHDHYQSLDRILNFIARGPARTFTYNRLQYLYRLHILTKGHDEIAQARKVPHRDFYNVRKVDTHIHHVACMNQKHLLRFIKSKLKKCPDEVVVSHGRETLTLGQLFASIGLTAYDLSIDTLGMHAHTDSFHRFDKFNLKYNPLGHTQLRDVFLRRENHLRGRYLAEITREVIADLESNKYQMVEWRVSIHGRNMNEWDRLAAWVMDHKLISANVRWLVQVPRKYAQDKADGLVENFEQVIQNLFQPLFEVTQNPRSHPALHLFLQRVVGLDSVDDESQVDQRLHQHYPIPSNWNSSHNPPYDYWIYHLFANLTSLNAWRKQKKLNTFVLRPHSGETGDPNHLASAFLCCHSISHGITLRKLPVLEYLFYLEQVGIAMSPLSNNALFLSYDKNPFVGYFKKGLNVSLSTDDPLQVSFTKEPLIEEYVVAAQVYKLSSVDMCELAKNSVAQSGFELQLKKRWLGDNFMLPGVTGNDVTKSKVPDLRQDFRSVTLQAECNL